MKKVYYLSTCDTCKRILNELPLLKDWEKQDLKTEPVSAKQLEEMKTMTGNYESLLNKRAKLYQERKLKEQKLSENDCRDLILDHYTFLKRPVFILEEEIFVGNSKKTVAALSAKLGS